mmetsp:Transcript_20453/g.47983  ORF Transcript_20453/g.47983 Transcript_20453/m.47983 type:complete len:330 (-) Transcript_20453:1325-2314(-)
MPPRPLWIWIPPLPKKRHPKIRSRTKSSWNRKPTKIPARPLRISPRIPRPLPPSNRPSRSQHPPQQWCPLRILPHVPSPPAIRSPNDSRYSCRNKITSMTRSAQPSHSRSIFRTKTLHRGVWMIQHTRLSFTWPEKPRLSNVTMRSSRFSKPVLQKLHPPPRNSVTSSLYLARLQSQGIPGTLFLSIFSTSTTTSNWSKDSLFWCSDSLPKAATLKPWMTTRQLEHSFPHRLEPTAQFSLPIRRCFLPNASSYQVASSRLDLPILMQSASSHRPWIRQLRQEMTVSAKRPLHRKLQLRLQQPVQQSVLPHLRPIQSIPGSWSTNATGTG